jgi:hypothetical protein
VQRCVGGCSKRLVFCILRERGDLRDFTLRWDHVVLWLVKLVGGSGEWNRSGYDGEILYSTYSEQHSPLCPHNQIPMSELAV